MPYGVISTQSGAYTDTSATLLGAKRYATFHGYTRIGRRANDGFHVVLVAVKMNGVWRDPNRTSLRSDK